MYNINNISFIQNINKINDMNNVFVYIHNNKHITNVIYIIYQFGQFNQKIY